MIFKLNQKNRMKTKNRMKMKNLLLIPLILGIFISINSIIATEPYFDSSYGTGLEGFLDYGNQLVSGWFVIAFLAVIWIVIVYTLSKSNWKMPAISSFAFFVTFITAIIMRLFITSMNEAIIFTLGVGLAGSIFWAVVMDRT